MLLRCHAPLPRSCWTYQQNNYTTYYSGAMYHCHAVQVPCTTAMQLLNISTNGHTLPCRIWTFNHVWAPCARTMFRTHWNNTNTYSNLVIPGEHSIPTDISAFTKTSYRHVNVHTRCRNKQLNNWLCFDASSMFWLHASSSQKIIRSVCAVQHMN